MSISVQGIHPQTGEILEVSVKGNFPLKDPDTNQFILDSDGQVVFPDRVRERDIRLDDQRREIMDPRPMSSAVAFEQPISVEEQVRMMIVNAQRQVDANFARAAESDVDFYDDDFGVPDEGGVDNMSSPYEFVADSDFGGDVPRALKGMFKRKEKVVQKDSDDHAIEVPIEKKSSHGGKRGQKASHLRSSANAESSSDDSDPDEVFDDND